MQLMSNVLWLWGADDLGIGFDTKQVYHTKYRDKHDKYDLRYRFMIGRIQPVLFYVLFIWAS